MKKLIKKWFSLTDEGAYGTIKASIYSFLVFISYMLPMIIVMLFMKNTTENINKSPVFYWGLIGGSAVIMFMIHFLEYNASYTETYKEAANLRIDIANILKKLPLSYFSKHNLADLSQTIMADVANIEKSLSHAIPKMFGFSLYFILMSILLITGHVIMGIAIVAPIVISFFVLILSKKIQISGATKYYQRLRDNSDAFQEAIEMQQEIKSYGQTANFIQTINTKIEDTEKVHINSEISMAVFMNVAILILKCLPGITIATGTYLLLKNDGSISLLYALGYLLASVKISDGLEGVYEYLAMTYFFDASFKRINELRNTEIQQGKTDVELNGYNIEFRNVEFGYNKDNKVLDKVSFTARQNEVTALVGPSGCGKTTILRLMSRLYDYNDGNILIGGVDIKDIDTETLFNKISIVFQDVVLFNTSIMENIRLGKKTASDEEVIRAAKLANVDDFVSNLPDGYNTLIGENGSKLSGGERQRISIARAILKDAPIIILDEISASLDVENEMKIQESLNTLIKNKTVVIISHRMKSIENVNQIVVLNQGRLDAAGTHKELLGKSELYKKMIEKSNMSEAYMY